MIQIHVSRPVFKVAGWSVSRDPRSLRREGEEGSLGEPSLRSNSVACPSG